MRLLEFQAKRMLQEYGISIPKGTLIRPEETSIDRSVPLVLKAQVPAGGRGKAGGIRFVRTTAEANSALKDLFATEIKGFPVQRVLAEEPIDIKRELYIAYLIDKKANLPMIMACASGGVDIEEVAKEAPERIIQNWMEPILGIPEYEIRSLAKRLHIDAVPQLQRVIRNMAQIFHDEDAALVEINPLVLTGDGLVAVDAKVLLDDKAAFRHVERYSLLQKEQHELDRRPKAQAERLAEVRKITYVSLEGDIGLIADGAGTGMLTLDLVHKAGGRSANFCEMGGLANAEIMRESMEVVLANPRVRVLLISLIGGLTRMDEMADGILQYVKSQSRTVPLAIRISGTMADVGKERLKKAGVEAFEDLSETVAAAVKRAKVL